MLGKNGYTFTGIHPKDCHLQDKEEFLKLFKSNISKIDGIGEIGLDGSYSQDSTYLKAQQETFELMLGLAEKHLLPVSVHSRNAVAKTIETLGEYSVKCVLLHWFSGTGAELSQANSMGYFVSFGPPIVYSKKLQKLAKVSNRELTLIETDGPVSYGACFGGRIADPTMLASVWHSMSIVLGVNPYDLEEQLTMNFSKYMQRSKG